MYVLNVPRYRNITATAQDTADSVISNDFEFLFFDIFSGCLFAASLRHMCGFKNRQQN
jgi:hypothetical protein